MTRFRLLIAILISAAASGCMASFSDRPARPQFVAPSPPPGVQIRSSSEHLLNSYGELVEMPFDTELDWFAANAVAQSGWVLREEADSEAGADLRVHVIDVQTGGPGLLSLLTAYLIPGYVDHRIEVQVSLDRGDGTVERCTRSVQLRTWYQTFLIFVYPFRSPSSARISSTEALALGCLAEVL